MNFNRVFILGNLTRQPESKALPSGQSVVNFGIATNRFYKDQAGAKKQETEFHNIVAFGKLAEICSRYLTKGSMALIEGRIKTRTWANPAGVKQYKTEIIAENIQLAPRTMQASTSGSGFSQHQQPEPEQKQNEEIPVIEESYIPPAQTEEPKGVEFADDGNEEIDISKIPF